MLDNLYEKMPKTMEIGVRFEVPKVMGHIQGNNTIISNFYHIADALGRKPAHLLKFVLKELASPGDLKKNGVIIGSKVSATRINEKIQKYVHEYVICRECGKPDTKLTKEGSYVFMRCLACGAKYSV